MAMIHFEIVSPESKLMSEDITMAVIPGEEGDFGVLSGHAPLVSNVRTGVISIYRESINNISERIFVAGGFTDVTADNCVLVAEQAINVQDIDKSNIEKQIAEIESDLSSISDDIDRNRFHKKLDILRAMVEAVS